MHCIRRGIRFDMAMPGVVKLSGQGSSLSSIPGEIHR